MPGPSCLLHRIRRVPDDGAKIDDEYLAQLLDRHRALVSEAIDIPQELPTEKFTIQDPIFGSLSWDGGWQGQVETPVLSDAHVAVDLYPDLNDLEGLEIPAVILESHSRQIEVTVEADDHTQRPAEAQVAALKCLIYYFEESSHHAKILR